MPTTITSAGITFNDATTLTSANGVPSALKLTTARTINGVSFDGTADITVPATGVTTAKAWVNFDGVTGTIRSSYNVSSVTKNGTGDYTVNFATPMADANYSMSGICNNAFGMVVGLAPGNSYTTVTLKTTSQVRIVTRNWETLYDVSDVSVQVLGN